MQKVTVKDNARSKKKVEENLAKRQKKNPIKSGNHSCPVGCSSYLAWSDQYMSSRSYKDTEFWKLKIVSSVKDPKPPFEDIEAFTRCFYVLLAEANSPNQSMHGMEAFPKLPVASTLGQRKHRSCWLSQRLNIFLGICSLPLTVSLPFCIEGDSYRTHPGRWQEMARRFTEKG